MPIIGRPPSSDGCVAQHRSCSAQRTASPPAVSCACRPQAAREMSSRCRPRHRDSAAARRPRRDVAANPREPLQTPTCRIPCPEASAPMPIPCRAPAPLRPGTRPGAPWTRRVACRQAASKGRDTFSGSSPHALRARTTRKTDVGILLFPCPTSLPPLSAHPRCMRLTRCKGAAVVIFDQGKVARRTACTAQSSGSWQPRPTSSST